MVAGEMWRSRVPIACRSREGARCLVTTGSHSDPSGLPGVGWYAKRLKKLVSGLADVS